MTTKSLITDNAESQDRDNIDTVTNNRIRFRVTAKKTYFDIHRDRRPEINVELSENNTNFHPRVEWTAGSTEIGIPYNDKTMQNEMIFTEPTTSILSSESSENNATFISSKSKRPLPPIPDTWGAVDVQPTQEEEIIHLIGPSNVLERSGNSQEKIPKAKKKFLDKFRKGATDVIVIKRLERKASRQSKLIQEDADTVGPEEEFQRLNENYVRDGIIPEDFRPDSFPVQQRLSKTENPVNNEWDRQSDVDKDHKASNRASTHGKRITINTNINSHSEEPETCDSPLPARRSCEPFDVKELRRLRDSELKPGPYGLPRPQDQNGNGASEATNELFETGKLGIPAVDDERYIDEIGLARSDSEESSDGARKNDEGTADSFKIDDPFSEFSLQTVERDKNLRKIHEMDLKKMPIYLDPVEPTTSAGISSIDPYSWKVSYNEIGENVDEKNQEQSYPQSEESCIRKTSFLDTVSMTEISERKTDGVRNLTTRIVQERQVGRTRNLQTEDNWPLCLVTRRMFEDHFIFLRTPFKRKVSTFARRKNELRCSNRDFTCYSLTPTFEYLLQNYLLNLSPRITGNTSNTVSAVSQRCPWKKTTDYLRTASSITLFGPSHAPRINCIAIREDYLRTVDRDEFYRITEILRSSGEGKTYSSSLPGSTVCAKALGGNLMEKIIRYAANIIFSRNMSNRYSISSFGPITLLVLTEPSSCNSKYINLWSIHSGPENNRTLLVDLGSTSFVMLLEKFANFRHSYKKR